MHETHAPENLHCDSLSSIGSFCLHFDISAPVVIFRHSSAPPTAAASTDTWHLAATSLTVPAQPRYALPVFSADVARAGTHLVQVAAPSKACQTGLRYEFCFHFETYLANHFRVQVSSVGLF